MRLNVLGFWKENYQDRLMLLGIIVGIWVLIKLIEEFVIEELVPQRILEGLPFDASLALLALMIATVILHNIYMFFAQFHRRRNPRPLNPDYRPSLDIFICAHNEEAVIGETLEHFMKYQYKDLNIYAINDRSSDTTLEIMQAKAQKAQEQKDANPDKNYPKIHTINRPKDAFPGKSAGLNDALRASQGEVICVFDADARIEPGFLESMIMNLEDPLVGAVQAQKVISNPETNFLSKCQFHEYAMDTYLQMGRDSIRGAVELRGNGQMVKRFTLEHVGGWNEETLTDDLDLSTCLHVNGWDIRFSPEDKVFEEGVITWQALVKQRRRWAEGSIRRYLNYLFHIATPGRLSAHQIFDTFVFMAEFSIPLWVSFDIVYEFIRFASGRPTYLSFLMIIFLGIGFIIFVNQFNGLRIYKKQGVFESLINTIITNSYLMSTWTTIIMMTYRKILFSRTVGKWTRTEHGV